MNAKFLLRALSVIFENPNWRRKLRTIAIVGVIGLLFSGGLVIWAGVSAAKYLAQEIGPAVATTVKAVESAEVSLSQEIVLSGELSPLGLVAWVERCWTSAEGVVGSENLIAGSLSGSISGLLVSIKDACLNVLKPAVPKNQVTNEEVI